MKSASGFYSGTELMERRMYWPRMDSHDLFWKTIRVFLCNFYDETARGPSGIRPEELVTFFRIYDNVQWKSRNLNANMTPSHGSRRRYSLDNELMESHHDYKRIQIILHETVWLKHRAHSRPQKGRGAVTYPGCYDSIASVVDYEQRKVRSFINPSSPSTTRNRE